MKEVVKEINRNCNMYIIFKSLWEMRCAFGNIKFRFPEWTHLLLKIGQAYCYPLPLETIIPTGINFSTEKEINLS